MQSLPIGLPVVECSGKTNGRGFRVFEFKANGHPLRIRRPARRNVVRVAIMFHSGRFVGMVDGQFQKMFVSHHHIKREHTANVWGITLPIHEVRSDEWQGPRQAGWSTNGSHSGHDFFILGLCGFT